MSASNKAFEMIADKQVEYIEFGFDQSVQNLNKLTQPCSKSTDQQTEISEIHNKIHSEIHSIDNEMQDKFKEIDSTPNQNKRKLSTACIRLV